MAIGFRATANIATGGGAQSTLTVTKPTGTVDNDVMYAAALTAVNTSTINTLSGWTTVIAQTDLPSSAGSIKVQRRVASSEGANYAFTLSAPTLWGVVVCSFSGGDTTTPEDGVTPLASTAGGTNPSANCVAPDLTSLTSNAWLITIHLAEKVSGAGVVSATPPSGMTERADKGISGDSGGWGGIEFASLALTTPTSTGTKSNTFTGPSSFNWVGCSIIFRESGATPPVANRIRKQSKWR